MKPLYPFRYLARVTIQFETAFIIGGGTDDTFFDDVFVADANGLPALPGSSLAGILRHAWVDAGYGDGNELFGFQEGDAGHGSRLSVSWGCIHDQNNKPIEGIIFNRDRIAEDPVLSEARIMTARDHVRINHRGAAADTGKFDERSVSAGHRFTFELLLEGTKEDSDVWCQLLTLLRSEAIRIGGKTRRGYGEFRVAALLSGALDITNPEGFKAFLAHPVSLAEATSLSDVFNGFPASSATTVMATLALRPEGFWMIGGGFDGEVDMAPLKANRIEWTDGRGTVAMNRAILTGSAVKGAIAHRVAFHYNRLTGVFAGEEKRPDDCTGVNNLAVRELFGFCKSKDAETKEDTGQRGLVIISDLFIEKPGEQKILNHVSIDRFTGGARTLDGTLFDEKPFYGGEAFTLRVSVMEADRVAKHKARQALAATLDDLAAGRLALGAGAGRGNGYFRSELPVQWNEAGTAWLHGGGE